jgi:hypothetical protein
MSYFDINPVVVNTSPFEQVETNAIRWVVGAIPRSADTAELYCTLIFVNQDGSINDMLYSYTLFIPKSVLEVWLDDSVIDQFIIDNSNGLFVKL